MNKGIILRSEDGQWLYASSAVRFQQRRVDLQTLDDGGGTDYAQDKERAQILLSLQ